MKSTTLRLDNPLLAELNQERPKKVSLSAFVRDILKREIKRRKMIRAANQYSLFLKDNPAEQEWLDEWEEADLTVPPIFKKGKKN